MARRFFASPYTLICGIALVVALLPLALPGAFYLRVAALVYINAIAVIGLNLLMGYAGQVSLGHAGFFGIGAFAVSLFPAGCRSLPARWSPGFWHLLSAGRSCGCAAIPSRWRRSGSAC